VFRPEYTPIAIAKSLTDTTTKLLLTMTTTSQKDSIQKAKTIWASGSYRDVAVILPPLSAHLVRAAKVKPGDVVLDLACDPGNTAITASRSGAKVVGIDITPELLVNADEEAAIANAEGIVWKEADAESLPLEDQSFDVVLSSVGHMFAPDPDSVTRELLRVCKHKARIAFTTWPPEHAIGRIFTAVANHMLPLPNAPPSPILWGIPEVIKTRLGKNVEEMHFERGVLHVPMLSENHFWHIMSTQFGPVMHALRSLDRKKAADLQTDFVKATEPFFYGNILHLDYLLTVAIKG
jgi:SAM-dependent methyltransferase